MCLCVLCVQVCVRVCKGATIRVSVCARVCARVCVCVCLCVLVLFCFNFCFFFFLGGAACVWVSVCLYVGELRVFVLCWCVGCIFFCWCCVLSFSLFVVLLCCALFPVSLPTPGEHVLLDVRPVTARELCPTGLPLAAPSQRTLSYWTSPGRIVGQ